MGGWGWRGQGLLQVSTALICPGKHLDPLGAVCVLEECPDAAQRSMQHMFCSLSVLCEAASTQLHGSIQQPSVRRSRGCWRCYPCPCMHSGALVLSPSSSCDLCLYSLQVICILQQSGTVLGSCAFNQSFSAEMRLQRATILQRCHWHIWRGKAAVCWALTNFKRMAMGWCQRSGVLLLGGA